MASFRICSGGNCSLSRSPNTSGRRNPNYRRSSVAIARRAEIPSIRESANGVAARQVDHPHRRISQEMMEEWVQESATEIVKNLSKAPLLIQVIEEADGRRRRLEVETAASSKNWGSGERHGAAEGVIVVEELKDGRDSRGVYWDGEIEEEEESTKAWGMVVQGRGLGCGPVSYLLKTSRVRSSNLGCSCTHFCLVRVNNFSPTAERQLADVWLS